MSITTITGTTFPAVLDGAPTGQAGTIGVQIVTAVGGTVTVPRTTSGITEAPAGSGIYTVTLTAPAAGSYEVLWDTGGGTPTYAVEELLVTAAAEPHGNTQTATLRAVRGQPATVSCHFDSPPTGVTVTITNDTGTVLVSAASATDAGGNTYVYTLTPTVTGALDLLTVTWVGTVAGQPQTFTTRVEIVGGFLFTLAELRSQSTKLASTAQYPDSSLAAMRTTVETALEKRLEYALVPRYAREITTTGLLNFPLLRSIRSVTIDGTALDAAEYASWPMPRRWYYGRMEVVYEHGQAGVDPEASLAGLLLAKSWLINGPVDDRALGFIGEAGAGYGLATPGRGGSSFGLPFVDAFVNDNRRQTFF